MFAFEVSTVTPCCSAPYYSLVIRDPYIIGSHPTADIAVAYEGISDQHVSLTVLHAHEAEKELAAAKATVGAVAAAAASEEKGGAAQTEEGDAARSGKGDNDHHPRQANNEAHEEDNDHEVSAPAPDSNSNNNNCLVVRVTALPSKGNGEVRIGNVFLQAGDSVIVRDGDVLFLGDGVSGAFHYRPLMVGLEVGTYPEDYVNDLRRMFDQLGATFVDEPIPTCEVPHVPIGQLYCTEELNDSTSCLAALAYGYSVVQPTYVFEWFAAVSKKASAPLSTLPSPARFEVPVRCTTHPTTTTYLRPESDTCPFSLFPIPSTAMTNRSRAELFAGRVFFFFTDAAATRYWRAVEDCGGAVYGPGDVEAAKEAIYRLVEAQQEAGSGSQRLPNNFYIVIDNTSEAVLLNSGLEAASPELLAFMKETANAYGASNLCVMGDHSLFTALLNNKFYEEPVPLTANVPVAAASRCNGPADGLSVLTLSAAEDVAEGHNKGAAGAAAPMSARTPRSNYSRSYNNMGASGANTAEAAHQEPATARSTSRMSTREDEQRHSLLPRTENRTPSRSQLRSYSRQRARSASMRLTQNDGVSASYEGGSYYGGNGGTPSRHGRRHLVPSVIEGEMRSFVEDFDMVRVRIYAFLVREEPKLDRVIATYHRNLYVNIDGLEYALEIRAQAEDFMEHVDDLLADPACHGAYTESLRRFWRDCSDMDMKAQHLLHSWDRRFPAVSLPRRSVSSRRIGSVSGRDRAPSSRSITPRGKATGASAANSPAPASVPQDAVPPLHSQHHTGDYLTTAAASHPRDPEISREHRDLYTSLEAAMRLQEAEDGEEQPFTQQQQQQQHNEASAGSGAPSLHTRGYSALSGQSRRRSLTPCSKTSRASLALHKTVPIDQRPPWVENWAEKAEEHPSQSHQQPPAKNSVTKRPACAAYRPSLNSTPVRGSAKESKTPRAVRNSPAGEVAKYAPNSVWARSNSCSVSRPRAAAAAVPPPAAKPHPTDRHETVLSDGSLKFSVEGEVDVTSPLEFVEEHPQTHSTHYPTDLEEDVRDLTEGTVDFAEEEPPTHAAGLADAHCVEKGDAGEATDEDESQVRTAPAPAPQPAPTAKPRKVATSTSRKPRSKSASASKMPAAAEQNGSVTNGDANERRRSKSKAEKQPVKPRIYPAWKY